MPASLAEATIFIPAGMEVYTATMKGEPKDSVVPLGHEGMAPIEKIKKDLKFWSRSEAFFTVTREEICLIAENEDARAVAAMSVSSLLSAVKFGLDMDEKDAKAAVKDLFEAEEEKSRQRPRM